MDFVVYHGAYELQTTEGPYDPADAGVGIDTPRQGPRRPRDRARTTTCTPSSARRGARCCGTPTEAAHTLGKLLRDVGEDNVLWGTDAVWYGSPQPQIMAFRAFQIGAELQERVRLPGADRRAEGQGVRAERGPRSSGSTPKPSAAPSTPTGSPRPRGGRRTFRRRRPRCTVAATRPGVAAGGPVLARLGPRALDPLTTPELECQRRGIRVPHTRVRLATGRGRRGGRRSRTASPLRSSVRARRR